MSSPPCPEHLPARRPSFKHAQSTTIHNKRRPRHSSPRVHTYTQENGSSVVETLDLSLPLSRRIERFSSLLEVSIQEALEQLQCLQADLSTDDEELTDDDIEEEEDEDTLSSSWSCDEHEELQHKRRHSLNNAGPSHVRIDGQYRAKRDAIVLQAFLQEVYTLLSGIRSEIHEQLPALLRFSSLSPVGNSLGSKPTCGQSSSSNSSSNSSSSSITERTKESQQAMLEAFSHNYAKAQELLSHLSLYSPLSISLPEFPSTLASLSSAARASLASGSQSARSMVRHASVSGSQSAMNMVRTASATLASPRIPGSPAPGSDSETMEASISTTGPSSSLSSDTSTYSSTNTNTSTSFPSFQSPSFTLPRPPISALRTFLSSESARLSSKLPARPSDLFNDLHLPSAVSDALDTASHFVHDEKERLKGYVVDEAEKLKLALQAGATRLLEFHELPHDWKNNKYILSGYRFIPADRPGKLLLSAVQWHNESISIHTHLLPAAYIIYYIFFVFPSTPLGDPQINTFYDRAANLTFLIASLSCLLLSAIWHLAAGCGTFSVFRSCATLDYLGISALISSSILSLTHAAFRCHPATDLAYNTTTCIFGALGLYLPWKPFFNERKYKNFRISFFLLLAGVGAAPVVHMCMLFGVRATWHFYTPVLYSLIAYKIGLLFYALDFPEKLRPGGFFDTIAHSHQFWHCAIVLAIYLHWSALKHASEAGLSGYSCMGKDPYEVQYFVRWIHRNRGEL